MAMWTGLDDNTELFWAVLSQRYATQIDKHCIICGAVENDSHLFFLCDLPQQVWASSDIPPFTHYIDPVTDGIQHILPHLFPSNSTEQSITTVYLESTK
jgi:hypothetical protein